MTSSHYCVTCLHPFGFRTYGFMCPIDLVRFLRRPPDHLIQITSLFEIRYQHPVYLGIVSAE